MVNKDKKKLAKLLDGMAEGEFNEIKEYLLLKDNLYSRHNISHKEPSSQQISKLKEVVNNIDTPEADIKMATKLINHLNMFEAKIQRVKTKKIAFFMAAFIVILIVILYFLNR